MKKRHTDVRPRASTHGDAEGGWKCRLMYTLPPLPSTASTNLVQHWSGFVSRALRLAVSGDVVVAPYDRLELRSRQQISFGHIGLELEDRQRLVQLPVL